MNRKSKNIIDRNPIVFISFFSILIIVIINVLFPKNKPDFKKCTADSNQISMKQKHGNSGSLKKKLPIFESAM